MDVTIACDGCGEANIKTGLGFLDHMLTAFTLHSGMNLDVECHGDLHVDDHHTVEDVALAMGSALDRALADRAGVRRFAQAYAPLDEALARAVVDLSGRSGAWVTLDCRREMIGDVATENFTHFFQSLAASGRFTLHVDVLRGLNDHHRVEAAFKATALAVRDAVSRCSLSAAVPSTKGVL